MKRLFTCLIMIILIILLSAITGCSVDKDHSTRGNEPMDLHNKELSDIEDKIKTSSFSSTLPTSYNISVNISLKQEEMDRIIYEVTVDEAKQMMKDVTLSAHLDPDMALKLKTSNVFFTNIFDIDTYPDRFLLKPGGEIKGVQLFRGFILDPQALDQSFVDLYETVYVKVSWKSSDHTLHTEYFKIKGTSNEEITEYIQEKAN
ncbi:hypothetical protein LOK74_19010 [Brevibacillus humidisoli]|uniref:hypothetical protein n=1 Tax=Brevibacillus humidisoli TaxID=2895522 RepID=UPI001E30CD10|nr:hypothetical protein [Brevibacillus humidisoli]UFJ40104.1 hypothetical protein LOK74_19010 [Brevibacillus humidisoli]